MRDFDYITFDVFVRNKKTKATEKKYILDTIEMPLIYNKALHKGYAKIADQLLELMVGNCDMFISEDIVEFADIVKSAFQLPVDYYKEYGQSVSVQTYMFFNNLTAYQNLSSLVFLRREVRAK